MSLFGKLIGLHSDERRRLEDFHTEIVANVLANDSELTLSWLRELRVSELEDADNVTVKTQEKLDPIEGLHDAGSRPDMVIRIRKGDHREVIFIESKIGSSEGDGQLSKYMDHLRALQGVDRKSLVFITRDYEPKDDLSDENKNVKFAPIRWSAFHRFLSGRESRSDTILELLQFMKENNMSQSNRFTTLHLLALTNHFQARSLMEATLAENIAEQFGRETHSYWKDRERKNEFIKRNKYAMEGWPTGADHQICYELGYWFPDEQPSDSPNVGMVIHVDVNAAEYPAIARAMCIFSEASKESNRKWKRSSEDGWEAIECTRKLEQFLATEDHVTAIRTWFAELLDDAASFRKQNPNLPWSACVAGGKGI